MADRLEATLIELGRDLEYPPTPDLSGVVHARLIERRRPASRWTRFGFLAPLAAVFLAALVVAGVLALWPAARDAVAERLGVRGVQVTQVRSLPTAVSGLDLGQPIALEDAQRRVPYPIQLPAKLGAPDAVFFLDTPLGGQIVAAYAQVVVFEFQGTRAGLGKGLPPGASVEEVSVNGNRALWIAGDPHVVFFVDAQGRPQSETTRVAGNVLLWENGGLTLRLEGPLTRDEALGIATSTRAGN